MLQASAPKRIVASPLARRLAREHGVDLAALRRGRRIVRADVEAFVASRPGPAPETAVAPAAPALQRRTVQRLSIAFSAAPVFAMLDEFASALGGTINGSDRCARVSPQAVVCKAWAMALAEGQGPAAGGETAGLLVRMLDAHSDRGVALSGAHQLRLSDITRALEDGAASVSANQTAGLRTAAIWFVLTAAIDIEPPAGTPHGCLAMVSALDRANGDGGTPRCRLTAVFDGDDSDLGRLLGIADLFKRMIEKPWGLVA